MDELLAFPETLFYQLPLIFTALLHLDPINVVYHTALLTVIFIRSMFSSQCYFAIYDVV